jgi:RES domain-containing protein
LTPLPAALTSGSGKLVAWRLEREKYAPAWASAEGAFLVGGRWSSAGRRVIYASLDPSTTIIEVAVHKGINTLDVVAHTLLEFEIDAAKVQVVQPADVPNPNWLRPGTISRGQQKFGDDLLGASPLVVVPSVVSTHSWNLLIDAAAAAPGGLVSLKAQERFALDTRLTLGIHI